MNNTFNNYTKPSVFLKWNNKLQPFILTLSAVMLAYSLYNIIYTAPTDQVQGETYRILYIHVPCAWIALLVYVIMAVLSLIYLTKKYPISYLFCKYSCYTGTVFTALTLITGSLWGKPMWGTYWVWDARLTSMLVLFLLYLGYHFSESLIGDKIKSSITSSYIIIIGLVNIPIIKYSVSWWNTLHQPATITAVASKISPLMLTPLVLVLISLLLLYLSITCQLVSNHIMVSKIKSVSK